MTTKILFFLLLGITTAYAQEGEIKSADKKYEQFAYIDAIKTYERVAEKGYKSVDLFQKLGNAYYFNSELDKAEKWYTALFALNQSIPVEYYYRYAQSLKRVGEYKKADEIMNQFLQKSSLDIRAQLYNQQKDYLKVIQENSGRYTIKEAGINSEYSDYGASITGNQLVFTSSRDIAGLFRKTDKWNNQFFTNLYSSKINTDGSLNKPEKFQGEVTTKYHESTPVFTKDGMTMYFTRNNYLHRKKQKSKDKTVLLKIYKAVLKDNQWTEVIELPFNSNEYSTAHPALSSDEKMLYFASNMPGTKGESDLFRVKIFANGNYGKPENLGDKINTEGKETFPFLSADDELYFASDGHPGLGGLDVFVSPLEKDDTYQKVFNVGQPINSNSDDFAFLIDSKSKNGFFSTNRAGTIGYDDIYKLHEKQPLHFKCEQLISGIITDVDSKEQLEGAQVVLYDANFNKIIETVTDERGEFAFEAECEYNYYIRVLSKEYETKEVNVVTPKLSGETMVNIQLDKKIKSVTMGDDLAKIFGIKIIYFDFNKSDIRSDAALDLEKIITVMKEYPKMKIDIRSHTDSRASTRYNERLSDKRAKSTMAYMIKNGVDKNQLTAKGYGESQLVNDCSDTVDCTEEQHQANRRSEFIITAME
ncbi:OmpA family protein [Flavobacterium sp. '19STA2R22 D10 B1']|uniref:OmpA family protein n=1 Tax=Flavobacterium aerium TaxID=3037261 RepID=UPI00278C5E77|nr:OmpA family protein [Flavobacterium sp. '19STA2R22 D10 B1']